jgi:hypothetical protein
MFGGKHFQIHRDETLILRLGASQFDANANPDGYITCFDCRSENGRLEAAKRGLMLALHLAKADNAAASELSPLASDSKMR